VYIEEVAPLIAVAPLYHWYVRLVPVAATLKLADSPRHIVVLATGCVVIAVFVLTVTIASDEIT
jgi:hypothetical protein